jgi:hypothetical protein
MMLHRPHMFLSLRIQRNRFALMVMVRHIFRGLRSVSVSWGLACTGKEADFFSSIGLSTELRF